MVAAYHLIWTAYGWWLPNDPRGSMSHEIRSADIAGLGELHYGRRSILPAYRDIKTFYELAQGSLKHTLIKFDDAETELLRLAFGQTIKQRCYTCYACAIMPDHVHMLIRKHRDQAEDMISAFQDAGKAALLEKPQAPRVAEHPVWGGPGWRVYLNSPQSIERVAEYIRQNPTKAKQPSQHWPFVRIYEGWMPGLSAGPQTRNHKR